MIHLGIDFGHGETSAAVFGRGEESAPASLELFGSKSIPSVMAIIPDGTVLIGNAALRVNQHDCFMIGWKRHPSQMTAEEKEETRLFMKSVWEELQSKYSSFVNQGEYSVHIAVPSGWEQNNNVDELMLYRDIAQGAGIRNVQIMRESSAIMAWAKRENRNLISGDDLQKGLLVVDAGSSTLDFTYLQENSTFRMEECGFDLGASLIDKMILKYAIEHSPDSADLKSYFDDNPIQLRICELEARKFKERYFNDGITDFDFCVGTYKSHRLRLETKIDMEYILGAQRETPCEKISLAVDLQPGKFSWREHFRHCLTDVREHWELNCNLSKVIKTGGASRMKFIDADVAEIFGSDVGVLSDPEPDTCVARGLAYLDRAPVTKTILPKPETEKKMAPLPEPADITKKQMEELICEASTAASMEIVKTMTENELSILKTFLQNRNSSILECCELLTKEVHRFENADYLFQIFYQEFCRLLKKNWKNIFGSASDCMPNWESVSGSREWVQLLQGVSVFPVPSLLRFIHINEWLNKVPYLPGTKTSIFTKRDIYAYMKRKDFFSVERQRLHQLLADKIAGISAEVSETLEKNMQQHFWQQTADEKLTDFFRRIRKWQILTPATCQQPGNAVLPPETALPLCKVRIVLRNTTASFNILHQDQVLGIFNTGKQREFETEVPLGFQHFSFQLRILFGQGTKLPDVNFFIDQPHPVEIYSERSWTGWSFRIFVDNSAN